ncbi:MAG TPA: hypothetical protein VMZ50_09280 [Phycisphaerae bacterium]|nr:hypothetical protein [Phycisphaerae bacterium]
MNVDTSDSETQVERTLQEAVTAFAPPTGLKDAVRRRIESEHQARPAGGQRRVSRAWVRGALAAAAAASVVIAAAAWLTWDGSVTTAYAELTEAIRNSQAAGCAHAIRIEGGARTEMWIAFRPFRVFGKTEGKISFQDFPNNRVYTYDTEKRTLNIECAFDGPTPEGLYKKVMNVPNLFEYVMLAMDQVKKQGAQVSRSTEKVNGKTLTVFALAEGGPATTRLYVDPETKRIVAMDEYSTGGAKTTTTTFDYLETAPADIYALGVPRDAKVIDRTPPAAVEKLVAAVNAAAKRFPRCYYAVTCTFLESFVGANPRPDVATVTVTYVKDGACRSDVYQVYLPRGMSLAKAMKYHEEARQTIPTDTLAALEAWTEDRKPDRIRFHRDYKAIVLQRGKDGKLVKEERNWPLRDATPSSSFWALPLRMAGTTKMMADKTPPQGKLVGYERRSGKELQQWRFDPARDYVCERYHWTVTGGPNEERQVLEYALTAGDQWYPRRTRKITDAERPGQCAWLVVNHLDDARKIDPKLFDPKNVTADMLAGPK